MDGREARLTRADAKLLRGLIELGEGAHDPYVILAKVYSVILDPRELNHPMTVLNARLGEPWWIERTGAGWSLRPPGSAGPPEFAGPTAS
ncbi:hypothetical protein [Kitasatospora sp. NPDC058190]|uniref:hypothetical protein n=1 Tax=Kitasatospora sp. NPDC058190 TaxID=3346371 RepID=UPI0036DF77D9